MSREIEGEYHPIKLGEVFAEIDANILVVENGYVINNRFYAEIDTYIDSKVEVAMRQIKTKKLNNNICNTLKLTLTLKETP